MREHTRFSLKKAFKSKHRRFRYGTVVLVTALPLAALTWSTAANDGDDPDAGDSATEMVVSEPAAVNPESSTNESTSVKNGMSVELHTSQQSSASGPDQAVTSDDQTSLTINGQNVPIPDNGQFHQTYTTDDGSTSTVDISVSGNSAGNSNSSSFTIDVNNDDP